MISAHESPLAAMAFDTSGTKLATASNKVFNILDLDLFCIYGFFKGTVIRVHSAIDGTRLFEFRRGVRRYVRNHYKNEK
jgi:autophagy-related protein 18